MAEILAEAAVEALAEGVAAAALSKSNEEYNLDNDPAIKDFTWSELLEYNKAFLRGEKKTTFYHASPLLPDQVPADLIRLHDLGVFTIDGQGTETQKGYNKNSKEFYEIEQRAYIDGFMPLDVARKFIREARKDPEVMFEVSQISLGAQLYLSDEIEEAWSSPAGNVNLTREKGAPTEEELAAVPWSEYTNSWGPMQMLSDMEAQKFKNWYKWVCMGLCYFFIVDKEFGQEPKSMAERVVGYLTAAGGGRRTKRRRQNRRKSQKRK